MSQPRRGVCNLMGASNVTQARALEILRAVAEQSDEIYAVEAGALRSDEIDPLPGWSWIHDPTDPVRAGLLYAVRSDHARILKHRYRLGCLPYLGKRRADSMRARDLLVVRTSWGGEKPEKNGVGHGPPKRNWFLDGVFFASVRLRNFDHFGGDMNRLGPWVARALRRQVRSVHVLALAMRKDTLSSRPRELRNCPGEPDHVPFVVKTLKEFR